jgi:hypothetical protein
MSSNFENQLSPSRGLKSLCRVGVVFLACISMVQCGCKKESVSTTNEAIQGATKSSEEAAITAAAEAKRQRENAIAIIDRVGGKYHIDEGNPDLPIVFVSLANTKINDEEMLQLRCLTDLKTLDMNVCTEVSDVGFAVLRDMKNLEIFTIWGCPKFTDASFEHLAGLTKMKTMNLGYSGNTITGGGIKWLKGMRNLRGLNLSYLNIEASQLSQLEGLVDLEALAFAIGKLDDEGLKYVLKFSNLQSLEIHGSKVTDTGLQQLAGLKKLKRLSAGGTVNITDEGVNQLKLKIPNLEVVRN